MTRRVERVETESELESALSVRRRVFVDEQGVPEDLELDEHDDLEGATHFLAYDGETVVGAARFRADHTAGDRTRAKVERVAVLPAYRGEGLGAQLMDAVEAAAEEGGFETLVLHAQTSVEGFYAKRGYETVGEEFEEAGIPHIEMTLEV